MAWAVRRMADVVAMAQQHLRPASAGWGSGSLPGQVFNRRYRMSDGTVRTNPGVENPDVVEPAGPTDPEVGLLVVRDRLDGTPIAAVGNYSLHYVGGGDGRSVSADYFAVVEQALNRELGHAFPVLWTNGCSGDINNVDVRTRRSDRSPYGQMVRVAEDAALVALGVWSGLSFEDNVPLESALVDVQVARRAISASEVEAAVPLVPGSDDEWTMEGVFAREVVLLSRWPAWEAAPVQAMRIGDLGIAGLPGEIFVEFGLEIKAGSPFRQTMVVELANGYVGYVPTIAAFEEGGYETRTARSSRLVPEAGPEMTATAIRLLGEIGDGSAGMEDRKRP
jgi:hypothetical protein